MTLAQLKKQNEGSCPSPAVIKEHPAPPRQPRHNQTPDALTPQKGENAGEQMDDNKQQDDPEQREPKQQDEAKREDTTDHPDETIQHDGSDDQERPKPQLQGQETGRSSGLNLVRQQQAQQQQARLQQQLQARAQQQSRLQQQQKTNPQNPLATWLG